MDSSSWICFLYLRKPLDVVGDSLSVKTVTSRRGFILLFKECCGKISGIYLELEVPPAGILSVKTVTGAFVLPPCLSA